MHPEGNPSIKSVAGVKIRFLPLPPPPPGAISVARRVYVSAGALNGKKETVRLPPFHSASKEGGKEKEGLRV